MTHWLISSRTRSPGQVSCCEGLSHSIHFTTSTFLPHPPMHNCVTSRAYDSHLLDEKGGLSEAQHLGTDMGAAARLRLETWGSWLHVNSLPVAHTSRSVHCNKGRPFWSSLEGSGWEMHAGGSLQPCPHIPYLHPPTWRDISWKTWVLGNL